MSLLGQDVNCRGAASREEALAFVDHVLGTADDWLPSLLAFRLTSAFQLFWKVEVGRWLMLADQLGFLARLKSRLRRALQAVDAAGAGGPNDTAHLILNQELTSTMTTYHLLRSGWSFVEWDPGEVLPGVDVDIRMRCPLGITTDIQVKAPDQPGKVVDYKIEDGEYDRRVLLAIDKGMRQIAGAPGPQRMVVVAPQRTSPIDAGVLTGHLIGRTRPSGRGPVLFANRRGCFASGSGVAVSAVLNLALLSSLDLARGIERDFYWCEVFLNPWNSCVPTYSCFPSARICLLREGTFEWTPNAPQTGFRLPTGTRYVPEDDDGDAV